MKPHERAHTHLQPFQPSVSRRALIAASVAGATAVSLPFAGSAFGQDATPVGTGIDRDALLALSQRLVGGGDLASDALDGLISLLTAEPDIESSLAELAALPEITAETLAAASTGTQRTATNILQYWYLGRYDSKPVPQRADIFFELVSWQALPYATQPTLCKGFGYWAADIKL
ncbi:MAG: sugar dehydrogenase complex small subunit [Thermomicrobiales bacterium]